MTIQVYGTTQCPNTRECLAAYAEKQLPHEFKDITELAVLKEFLALRDRESLFDAVKQEGRVGIPLIRTAEGAYTHDWKALL